MRLRERAAKKSPQAGGGTSSVSDILALTAGPAKAADVLRTAMAMGADRSILVEHDAEKEGGELEPLAVAKLLKAVAEREDRNLVILGKQSIDDDSGQTGQMLAGLLGWGQATQASKVEVEEGGTVKVVREVDGGVETLRARLPMVITTDLRLNEPRYASLPNIMKAKKKEMKKMSLSELGLSGERRLKTVKVIGEWDFLCAGLDVPYSLRWPLAGAYCLLCRGRLTCACRTATEERRRQSRRRGWLDREAQGAGRVIKIHCLKARPPDGLAKIASDRY